MSHSVASTPTARHACRSDRDAHRAQHPDAVFHVYPAGHGFNCDERADYDPHSAQVAMEHTIDFFTRHLR